MYTDGHTFYMADAGVWLAALVPPGYLNWPSEIIERPAHDADADRDWYLCTATAVV